MLIMQNKAGLQVHLVEHAGMPQQHLKDSS
jgi:hypothetical protein